MAPQTTRRLERVDHRDSNESIARNDFYGTLPGGFTAHPKIDPATGEMHAMAYAWAQWMDHVQYIVVGTDGRVRHSVDIPLPGMTMLHDMSLTERYAPGLKRASEGLKSIPGLNQ